MTVDRPGGPSGRIEKIVVHLVYGPGGHRHQSKCRVNAVAVINYANGAAQDGLPTFVDDL